MKYELDDIDRILVRELQENARASNVELARTVNLTEGAVRRRVDHLLKSKVLRLMGVGDPQSLGLTTHAMIGMKLSIKTIDEVIDQLVAMPQFSFVYQTLGEFDVVGVAFFPSNAKLGEFITGELAQVEGVLSVSSFLILNTPKRHFVFGETASTTD